MATDTRTPETKIVFLGEAALVYCASFEASPAIAAGATISNPVVSVDIAKVTLGNPQINAAVFNEYDANGNVGESVPANKGVIFTVTPLAKGQCTVTIKVSASDGSTPGKQIAFQVR